MDFHERLQKAAERGQRNRDAKAREEAAKALSEEECRRLHTKYRLELNDYIEQCLHQLADQFPGFRLKSLVEGGWGAAVSRDDVDLRPGQARGSFYSGLEIVVPPLGRYKVLELAAKATIRNKELFNRTHFQRLGEVDLHSFRETIDLWVLEYAEQFAAQG